MRGAIELLTETVGAPAQVEMPFPPKVGALTPPTIRTRCADCNIGTITLGEWYMVRDDVWQHAWAGRLIKRWRDAPGPAGSMRGLLRATARATARPQRLH